MKDTSILPFEILNSAILDDDTVELQKILKDDYNRAKTVEKFSIFYLYSNTPIHLSIRAGSIESAKVLLGFKKLINIKNIKSQTPMHLALKLNQQEIALFLAEAGCNIDLKDCKGYIALHYAALNGYLNIANFLLSKGSSVNALSNKFRTPLHLATKHGHIELVQILINYKCAIDKKDWYGNTALHYASKENYYRIAEILIKNGISINSKNNDLKTALYYASHHSPKKFAALLIKNGANVQDFHLNVNKEDHLNEANDNFHARLRRQNNDETNTQDKTNHSIFFRLPTPIAANTYRQDKYDKLKYSIPDLKKAYQGLKAFYDKFIHFYKSTDLTNLFSTSKIMSRAKETSSSASLFESLPNSVKDHISIFLVEQNITEEKYISRVIKLKQNHINISKIFGIDDICISANKIKQILKALSLSEELTSHILLSDNNKKMLKFFSVLTNDREFDCFIENNKISWVDRVKGNLHDMKSIAR